MKSGAPVRRQAAERAAINAPMQGTAADLIKLAMVAVQDFLDKEQMKSMLIMQVHDELVLEVLENELPVVKERVRDLMQRVARLDVALVARQSPTKRAEAGGRARGGAGRRPPRNGGRPRLAGNAGRKCTKGMPPATRPPRRKPRHRACSTPASCHDSASPTTPRAT